MNRRDFFKKTSGAAAAAAGLECWAGFGGAENKFWADEDGEVHFEEVSSTLVSQVKVSARIRELAKSREDIRRMIQDDIASAGRQALDADAGITTHDRVICHDLELDIDEWMAGKRRARELGVLPETVYPEVPELEEEVVW